MSMNHGRQRKSSSSNTATTNSSAASVAAQQPHQTSNATQKKKTASSSSTSNSTNPAASPNNSAAPTNAVYPILRPLQQKNSVPEVATANGSLTNGKCFSRGQCVNPKPATQQRIVTSVAEFVSEVIPQSSNQLHAQNEQIHWVRIEKCPLDEKQRRETFVVIVGLARGYQIWMMQENGVCEEVISERRGPLRVGHLLPFPVSTVDKFQDDRPLFALVDGNPMCAENKFCSVNFLSLRSGRLVHSLKFNEPVLDLASSNNSFVVVLSESLVVCDSGTLSERCCFVVPPTSDPSMNPVFAISDSLLAFADCNLNTSIQSCGGRVDEEDHSYGVINAAKTFSKTVTSIGESLVSSFSAPAANDRRANAHAEQGVVSVLNLNDLPRSDDPRPSNSHYLAHFVAHKLSVGHLAFGNGGRLLFTSNESSTTFNIFILNPHPVSCRLGSVQHIYTLHRGNSAAKVIDTAFSSDNRWLGVATNHGTTHIFAICPYGGAVSLRTHGGHFVNKESRFDITAGLNSETQVYSVHHKQPPSSTSVDHPASTNPLVARTVVNPRITRFPHPPPIVLWSYAKIKQHVFSAENLSAWASDNTPVSLASGSSAARHAQFAPGSGHAYFESARRLALCFGTSYGERCASGPETPVLFIANADGMLYQYKIEIRRERLNSTGSVSSLNNNNSDSVGANGGLSPSGATSFGHQFASPGAGLTNGDSPGKMLETPVQIRTLALSQWSLTRPRGTNGVNFVSPPLHESSPIIKATLDSAPQKRALRKTPNNGWLQNVEVTTYCGPHRRLWMGPQFTFGVYTYTGHASAELISPNTTMANKPLQVFTTAQKCCPVLIEKNSNVGILRCDTSIDATSRIVCGSWTSDSSSALYANDPLANLKEQLEEAMQDQQKNHHHHHHHSQQMNGKSGKRTPSAASPTSPK